MKKVLSILLFLGAAALVIKVVYDTCFKRGDSVYVDIN